MKNAIKLRFLHSLLIPLSLEQWTPVPINSGPLPQISSAKNEWTIETNKTAGGYVYLLPEKISLASTRINWDWKVLKYPEVKVSIPFQRKNDDFAIRLGVLVEGTKSVIDIPKSMSNSLDSKKYKLSYIVFYSAAQEGGEQCDRSPYQNHILYSLKQGSSEWSGVSASPSADLSRQFHLSDSEIKNLKIIGVWLFADSDNSKSQSQGFIRNIRIEEKVGER